jgi:hypothetical protein
MFRNAITAVNSTGDPGEHQRVAQLHAREWRKARDVPGDLDT